MKSLGPAIALLIIFAADPRDIAAPGGSGQNGPRRSATFVGQIMDSKCATTGSHEANRKKLEAKDARECTLKCAKDASFVLYDPGTKTVYQLADQEKPMRFSGQKVKVSGQYDEWSQTIEIESIDAAP
jgi:hypothetical protein